MTQHDLKPLNARQIAALTANLNPDRVSQRKGTGSTQLSYMEAYDVKATLIKVFGFGGFSAEVVDSSIERILTQEEAGGNAKWVVLCSATVKLTIHQLGAIYTETAVSSQAGSQIGEVADFAMKTAESDALKRAAIYLGTQFGLSLYNKGSFVDVVKVVLADGQEWPALNPDQKAQKELAAARELEYIAAIIDGVDPAKAKEEIWGTPSQPQQQAVTATVPEGSAQTPEQYAESQALVQRALSMRAQQAAIHDNQQSAGNLYPEDQGVDFAAMAAEEQGQAAVLSD